MMATTDRERMSFDIKDKELIKKCMAFCNQNNLKNFQFAEMAFKAFFDNRRNQLMAMNKEQLIDILMDWEGNKERK
jgi:hypothetical protein